MKRHVLLCALALLTAWGVRPSNQTSSCYVPNYQTPWPVAMCDKTVGQDCVVGRVSFGNATACCRSQFPNLDHPYGDTPLELKGAGIAVCGVVRGASPPPLSCFRGNETCSCWVPTWSPWGCVAAADAECFRGYDVSETQGACCTALISRSESDAIKGGCGSICQKSNDGVWSCNKTDPGNSNSPTSPSPAPSPTDFVEAAKKLPKCRLDGKVVTLKKPVLRKESRSARGGSASDEHEHGAHGCGAKPKDVSMEFKAVSGSRKAGTLKDVVEIDIYFNIMESPKNDSFERVTRTQIEQTVEFMNEKYFFPQLNQGFKFTLKGIYRWEQNEAAWAWTEPDLLSRMYEEAEEVQPEQRVACSGAWKEHMRKTVLGDQLKRRDVLMAYIVDYQYTSGLQGQATFPSDLFDRKTGKVSLRSLYIDGFEGDPSSLTGYKVERPHLGPDLPIGSGGTIAHEVGHWLGLYHTFEDSLDLEVLNPTASSNPNNPPFLTTSCKFNPLKINPDPDAAYGNRCCELNDLVDDTPRVLKDKDFYNTDVTCTGIKCDCKSKVYSCGDPQPDLLNNLMDYLDACYEGGMFTVGQLLRMREQGMKYRF